VEADRQKEVKLRGVWFVKQVGFKPGVKERGGMDEQSGESKEEEAMGEGIVELEMKEPLPEWGWRRDKGSWFERQGEA